MRSELGRGFDSLDLFYDIFNLLNRDKLVAPTGNRASPTFMILDGRPVPTTDAVRNQSRF
jgi:hypothetical protein